MRFTIGLFLALLIIGRSTDAQVGIKETANVYAGTFIGEPAAEPDAAWRRYAVVFDIQTREGIKADVATRELRRALHGARRSTRA